MKTSTRFFGFLAVLSVIFCCTFCKQKVKELKEEVKIENTLKSVSFLNDSIKTEPSDFLSKLERINMAIDSIGYPDAGYKLWLVQGDSVKNFKFLLEGFWPNQAIYDTIHKNKLYTDAFNREIKLWKGIKSVSYHRFALVK